MVISSMVCSFESYIFSAVSTLPEDALGRPPLRPLALAASSPDFVRCRMRSLSNWDSPAKIVKGRLSPRITSHIRLAGDCRTARQGSARLSILLHILWSCPFLDAKIILLGYK